MAGARFDERSDRIVVRGLQFGELTLYNLNDIDPGNPLLLDGAQRELKASGIACSHQLRGDVPFCEPSASVFNRDGTFAGWDNLEEGGMPGVSVKFSPKAGAWKRTGPRSMKIVEIRQLYTLDGVPIGIIRLTGAVEFPIGDADHATGTFANEFLGCPTPTTCPNAAEAPAIPPFGSGTFTLTRLQP